MGIQSVLVQIGKSAIRLVQALGLLLLFAGASVSANEDGIAPEVFLDRVFAGEVPQSRTVWMSGDVATIAEDILGHRTEFLRLRYWGDATRSAWIVDEIGKTEPITFGIVIANNSIESAEVLVFRESRGWEIKYEFFTGQFQGAQLQPGHRLNRDIDGISGATLSVKAMTRVTRLVLYLAETLST